LHSPGAPQIVADLSGVHSSSAPTGRIVERVGDQCDEDSAEGDFGVAIVSIFEKSARADHELEPFVSVESSAVVLRCPVRSFASRHTGSPKGSTGDEFGNLVTIGRSA
jgi:hypothetical protein